MSTNLYGVYGASGFGREVMPVLRAQLPSLSLGQFVFVDDNPSQASLNGHDVLSFEQFLAREAAVRYVTLAIANSAIREKLALKCAEAGVQLIEVTASNSVRMDEVEIGAGAIISPFVTITSNVKIGINFHANIYSYIAHDCEIGDYVTFAPSVKCNGNVRIEDHAYIGTGAILRQGKPGKPLVIGRGAVVGMGAVVTKDVPPGVTVVGNPARPLIKD